MDTTAIVAMFIFGAVIYFIAFVMLSRLDERRERREQEQAEKAKREQEQKRLDSLKEFWEMDPDYWKKGIIDPWIKRDSDGDPIREPSPTE